MFVYICCYGYRLVVSIVTFGYIHNCVHFGCCVTLSDWIVLLLVKDRQQLSQYSSRFTKFVKN